MGVPVYPLKDDIRRFGIQVFSSNYILYGDMSRRVMTTLESLPPRVNMYSVTEAFLDVTGIDHAVSFEDFGRQVRDTVYQNVGLPVCVGIAPARTLSKLANYGAKKYRATGGVMNLIGPRRQRRLMGRVPIAEVWGARRKLTAKLHAVGILMALQLTDTDLVTLNWLRARKLLQLPDSWLLKAGIR
jgi:DNA polymerase V